MHNAELIRLIEHCSDLITFASKSLAYPDRDILPDGKSVSKQLPVQIACVQAACLVVISKFNLDQDKISQHVDDLTTIFSKYY